MTTTTTSSAAAAGPSRTPAITRLPIAQADHRLVDAAVDAVADALLDPEWVRTKMRSRLEGALAGTYPPVLDLFLHNDAPVGWVGWAPYTSSDVPQQVWESTIFFAPELRGSGLLPHAFCWQSHLAEAVPDAEDGTPVTLVSSIGDWNTRSIRAHRTWANACGWEAGHWEKVDEPTRGRSAVLLHWPTQRPIPHPCLLDA